MASFRAETTTDPAGQARLTLIAGAPGAPRSYVAGVMPPPGSPFAGAGGLAYLVESPAYFAECPTLGPTMDLGRRARLGGIVYARPEDGALAPVEGASVEARRAAPEANAGEDDASAPPTAPGNAQATTGADGGLEPVEPGGYDRRSSPLPRAALRARPRGVWSVGRFRSGELPSATVVDVSRADGSLIGGAVVRPSRSKADGPRPARRGHHGRVRQRVRHPTESVTPVEDRHPPAHLPVDTPRIFRRVSPIISPTRSGPAFGSPRRSSPRWSASGPSARKRPAIDPAQPAQVLRCEHDEQPGTGFTPARLRGADGRARQGDRPAAGNGPASETWRDRWRRSADVAAWVSRRTRGRERRALRGA